VRHRKQCGIERIAVPEIPVRFLSARQLGGAVARAEIVKGDLHRIERLRCARKDAELG